MIAGGGVSGELWVGKGEGEGGLAALGGGRTNLDSSSCCAGNDTAEGGWLLLSLGLDFFF